MADKMTPDGQKLADALQREHEATLRIWKVLASPPVKFTPEQEARIRAHVEAGETLQAQQIILDGLKEQFKDNNGE